jgi:hypothetical protein
MKLLYLLIIAIVILGVVITFPINQSNEQDSIDCEKIFDKCCDKRSQKG